MPRYECRECNSLVDTHSDVVCPECGCKKPFTCSKCGKHMNQVDIYKLESLKIKKSLFCQECGYANEVVECAICKKGLVRSTGKQLSEGPDAKVYHKQCYEKQMQLVDNIKNIFTPIFGGIGFVIGYLFLGGYSGLITAIIGAVVWVGLAIGLQQILTPR